MGRGHLARRRVKVASHTDPDLFYETADTECVWCERELLDDDIMLDDEGRPHCSADHIKRSAADRAAAATIPYEIYREATP